MVDWKNGYSVCFVCPLGSGGAYAGLCGACSGSQGEELAVKAGGMAPFLNAFFSGRKLTMEEALELKDLIDQHTWED